MRCLPSKHTENSGAESGLFTKNSKNEKDKQKIVAHINKN
jgi:hypothetical protein